MAKTKTKAVIKRYRAIGRAKSIAILAMEKEIKRLKDLDAVNLHLRRHLDIRIENLLKRLAENGSK